MTYGDNNQMHKGDRVLILFIYKILGILAVLFFLSSCGGKTIKNITIEKWDVIEDINDDEKYGIDGSDLYEGTIKTDYDGLLEVVLLYKTDPVSFRTAFIENGEGVVRITRSSEEREDSIEDMVEIYGYFIPDSIDGDEIDFKYRYDDYNHYSYSKETTCEASVDISLDNHQTGLLFVEVTNGLSPRTDTHNAMIPIIDGKGFAWYYIEGLPLGYDGEDVCFISAKAFCSTQSISEKDYEVLEEFAVSQETGNYYNSYDGEGTISFPKRKDGFILYDLRLMAGGNPDRRGRTDHKITYIHDEIAKITSHDLYSNDEDVSVPKYQYNILGYIPWNRFNK